MANKDKQLVGAAGEHLVLSPQPKKSLRIQPARNK